MFSKTTEYALRATIYIAQKSAEDKKLSIDEISDAIGSPRSFTAKILQKLSKGNKVVSSIRGPHGGFYITQRGKRLPISTILELMEEEGVFKKCVLGLKKCSSDKPCPLHHQYQSIKMELIAMFERNTIQHLIHDGDMQKLFINANTV